MTQTDLNRAVAAVTGESLSTIRRRGFGPLMDISLEAEREPLTVDWDLLEAGRENCVPSRPPKRQYAA